MAIWTGTLPTSFLALAKVPASAFSTLADALHGLTDAETSYTPQIFNNANAWTLGNASVDCTYRRAGKFAIVSGLVTYGSTSSQPAGGQLLIGLPVNMRRGSTTWHPVGMVSFFDSSAGSGSMRHGISSGSASQVTMTDDTGGIVTNTSVFTFATGDSLRWQFIYETA